MSAVPMVGVMEVLFVAIFSSGMGVPLGVPPAEPDPILAQVAPEQCLFYSTWAGMGKADPESGNSTERLIAEPEVQQFVQELESTVRKALQQAMNRGNDPMAADLAKNLPTLLKTLITHPTAFFVERVEVTEDRVDVTGAAVINLGDALDATRDALNLLTDRFPDGVVTRVEIDGMGCLRAQVGEGTPAITLGFKQQYLILGVGDGSLEGVLERAVTPPPAWLTESVASLEISRPSAFSYANVEAIFQIVAKAGGGDAERMLDLLGLSTLTSSSSMSGLDASGFVKRTRFLSSGPAKGLLTLLPRQSLGAADLAPIPRDASIGVAFRLDLAQLLDQALDMVREADSKAADEIERGINSMEQPMQIQLQDDLLRSLGDVWTLHSAPRSGGLLAGWTLTVQLRDAERFEATHKKLLQFSEIVFAQHPGAARIKTSTFNGTTVHSLDVSEPEFFVVPSWCVSDNRLVITLLPQTLKSYLSSVDTDASLAQHPAIAKVLAADPAPFAISFQDTQSHFMTFYPWIQYGAHFVAKQLRQQGIEWDADTVPSVSAIAPHLQPSIAAMRRTDDGFEFMSHTTLPGASIGASAPVLVAALLPAIQSARESARRMQSSNNMKQIALAMHNYHDVFKGFPAAYSENAEGKPLLSWRVHILPYIEENSLYEEFHLDEPWDSPHNRTLIARMPGLYRSPNSVAAPDTTVYLGNAGKDGIFVPPAEESKGPKFPRGIQIRDIRDGTSNTIAVIEANDSMAVIWSKPEDYIPAEDDASRGLTGMRPGGFLAAFCDGSVQLVNTFMNDPDRLSELKGMFTRAGGEVVDRW